MSKLSMEKLKGMGEYLSLQDMMDVFDKSRATIYRYETRCIDGFPRSMSLLGEKCWSKEAVLDYWKKQEDKAAKFTELMNRRR